MKKLSKTSLNYYLSEYLEDLGRAGVKDFYRGDDAKGAKQPPEERLPAGAIVAGVLLCVGETLSGTCPRTAPDDVRLPRGKKLDRF